jgi:hypothetical protein
MVAAVRWRCPPLAWAATAVESLRAAIIGISAFAAPFAAARRHGQRIEQQEKMADHRHAPKHQAFLVYKRKNMFTEKDDKNTNRHYGERKITLTSEDR